MSISFRSARPLLALAALAAAFALPAPAQPPRSDPPPPARVAIVDVTVLPMDADRALEHQTVVLAGDRIVALGPAGETAVPEAAQRIDGRGRFLLPGLTDAHVHLFTPTELPLYLANGVTTVFNLNGRPAHLAWRAGVAAGTLLGPRIVTTGPTFMSAYAPEEAARRVDEQAGAGYDGVKVYVQVGAAEHPAIAAAAKRHRLLFTGHVSRRVGFEATLAAGQSIAHAEEYMYSFFNPAGDDDTAHIVYDPARIPEAVRRTAAAGVHVTPTLATYRDIVRQATALGAYLENPELDYLAPWLRSDLDPGRNRYDGRYPPDEIERMKVSLDLQRKLVRALAAAGVPILAGTDATSIGPVAGFAIHEELAELVAAGLTPYEALTAATTAPARYLSHGAESGTVAPGERADLVLLAADPRADIRATRRVEGVVAGGRWLDRAALDEAVATVPPAYQRVLDRLVGLLDSDVAAAEDLLAGYDPLDVLAGAALERYAAGAGEPALRALVERARSARRDTRLASEEAINVLGYRLLGLGRAAEAIAMFEANVAGFPASANALDSLAEAWAKQGATERAAALYAKALETDPVYGNAAFARDFVAAQARRPRD